MQTPFPINTYDITKVPSSIVAKFRLQTPYYNFSELKSQASLNGLPSLLKCPKYLLEDFKKMIAQFSFKYLGDNSQEIVEELLLKGSRLDMEIQGRKGLRQLAAAIVIGEFSDKIRIRIKEYAALNSLYCKTLTKNFIKYQQLKKQKLSYSENSSEEVKHIESDYHSQQKVCKLEQMTYKLQQVQEQQSQLHRREKTEVGSVKQAIQFIYDKVFQSQKMQKNRRQIINKMNQKIHQSIYNIQSHLQIGQKSPSRLFAIVFAFIRSMGISYPLAKFNEGIRFATGHSLKYDEVLKIKTISEMKSKKNQMINFSIKQQDDSSSFLSINDQLFA